MAVAYSGAKVREEQDPVIQEILWGYKYVTVGDDRVRPAHWAMEGTTLPKEDSFWDTNTPPNGWNCRCTAIPLFEEEEIVNPPSETEDDQGNLIPVRPDEGWSFNPGRAVPAVA